MMCLVLVAYCFQGVCWKSSLKDRLVLHFVPLQHCIGLALRCCCWLLYDIAEFWMLVSCAIFPAFVNSNYFGHAHIVELVLVWYSCCLLNWFCTAHNALNGGFIAGYVADQLEFNFWSTSYSYIVERLIRIGSTSLVLLTDMAFCEELVANVWCQVLWFSAALCSFLVCIQLWILWRQGWSLLWKRVDWDVVNL